MGTAILIIAFLATLWCVLYYMLPESPRSYNDYADLSTSTNKYIKSLKQPRKTPPRATFFGRIDGKSITKEGPYEENFLSYTEAMRWEREKKKK